MTAVSVTEGSMEILKAMQLVSGNVSVVVVSSYCPERAGDSPL